MNGRSHVNEYRSSGSSPPCERDIACERASTRSTHAVLVSTTTALPAETIPAERSHCNTYSVAPSSPPSDIQTGGTLLPGPQYSRHGCIRSAQDRADRRSRLKRWKWSPCRLARPPPVSFVPDREWSTEAPQTRWAVAAARFWPAHENAMGM